MRRPSLDEPVSVVSSKGLLEKRGSRKRLRGPRRVGVCARGCIPAAELAQQVVLYTTENLFCVLCHKELPPGTFLGEDL